MPGFAQLEMPSLHAHVIGLTQQQQRQGHVLRHVQVRQHMKRLEHKADKCVLAGIELMPMIRIDQCMLAGCHEMSFTNQFYVLKGQICAA